MQFVNAFSYVWESLQVVTSCDQAMYVSISTVVHVVGSHARLYNIDSSHLLELIVEQRLSIFAVWWSKSRN